MTNETGPSKEALERRTWRTHCRRPFINPGVTVCCLPRFTCVLSYNSCDLLIFCTMCRRILFTPSLSTRPSTPLNQFEQRRSRYSIFLFSGAAPARLAPQKNRIDNTRWSPCRYPLGATRKFPEAALVLLGRRLEACSHFLYTRCLSSAVFRHSVTCLCYMLFLHGDC